MSSISSSSLGNVAAVVQQQQAYAQKNNAGLQDRSTHAERLAAQQQTNETITQNHGFEARQYVKEALTNNTKIINTRADQRGTVVNITA